MAKYLLACYPIPGHLNPNIALAETLRLHGHQVAIYSGSKAKATIESMGFSYFAYHPEMDARINSILMPSNTDEAITSDLTTMKFPFFGFDKINSRLKNWFLSTVPHQIEDLNQVIKDWNPDVIVSDIALFGPILFLHELCEAPVAIFCVLPACSIPGPDSPTWGRGLPPPRNFIARLQSWIEEKVRNIILSDFRAEVDRLRSCYGLSPLKVPVMEYTGRLPLYLVVGTPEFDYNRQDLPASVHYVGPCLWHRPANDAPPDWLSRLSRDTPTVYVTEGTIHVRKNFLLEAAANGLSGENIQVIMTTGQHRDPEDMGIARSENIRIEKYVSHGDLFPFVDVVITTGGTGTILTALKYGIPLIVVPTGWDLPENAQRVVESGVGIRINPSHCSSKRIHDSVYEVLHDPQYRENARKMGDLLGNRGGSERAMQLLEGLL